MAIRACAKCFRAVEHVKGKPTPHQTHAGIRCGGSVDRIVKAIAPPTARTSSPVVRLFDHDGDVITDIDQVTRPPVIRWIPPLDAWDEQEHVRYFARIGVETNDEHETYERYQEGVRYQST